MLVSHSKVRWVERKLSKLWSETKMFKRAVQTFLPVHCTSRLHNLEFLLPDHSVRYLGSFSSILFTGTAPFEHFGVPARQSYRMMSRRLSTRMQETEHRTGSVVCTEQRSKVGLKRCGCGAAGARRLQRLERVIE